MKILLFLFMCVWVMFCVELSDAKIVWIESWELKWPAEKDLKNLAKLFLFTLHIWGNVSYFPHRELDDQECYRAFVWLSVL